MNRDENKNKRNKNKRNERRIYVNYKRRKYERNQRGSGCMKHMRNERKCKL